MGALKVKSRVWIIDEDERMIMGEGRRRILEEIDKTGSMNQAAKNLKMSYKAVWSKIRATEASLSMRIVFKDKRKGTYLTEKGREVLALYRQLKERCLFEDDAVFRGIFEGRFPLAERDFRQAAEPAPGVGWEGGPEGGRAQEGLPPVVSLVGPSGVGKTTLLERLIPALGERLVRVATVKHDVHGFEMDREGKDSWRHKRAGALITLISSPARIGMVKDVREDTEIDDLLPLCKDVDLVITEGYKRGNKPKVEVHRPEVLGRLLCTPEDGLIAVVSDVPVPVTIPRFLNADVSGLAEFLISHFGLGNASP